MARAEAITRKAEDIRTALIPNASHMVNSEQIGLTNSYILDFLWGDK